MRRCIQTAVVCTATGLPLAWGPKASCEVFDADSDTKASAATAATSPDVCRHPAPNAMRSAPGVASSEFSLTSFALRYLPGAVHALAEAPTTRPLQTAYRIGLMQPVLSYMPEAVVSGARTLPSNTLQEMEAAVIAGCQAGLDPTQVVTMAWALAWAGHEPGQRYVEVLQAAATSGALPGATAATPRLAAAHRAVLLWCAVMHGAAPPPVWESGLRAAAAAAGPGAKALDECALMYLLHAALLYCADVAPPGRRTASSLSGPGAAVSPTSPAAASAASAACQPRATREEVLAAAAPLGRKALEKLAAAYGEYVPLHPAIEGPYLALLYVLEQLAVGCPVTSGGGDQAAAEEEWAPRGAASQAAAVLANPKELARVKRDLLYHWRGDTLVDEVQRARNQLVFLLTRRLGLTVAQPDDVDVAVPSRWLAVYVRSSTVASAVGSTPAGAGAGAGATTAAAGARAAAAPSLSDLEAAAGEALEALVRDRFAPQVRMPAGSSASPAAAEDAEREARMGSGSWFWGPAGMWAARVRQLRRLGWRVVVVDVEAWRRMASEADREAYLARLLRSRPV